MASSWSQPKWMTPQWRRSSWCKMQPIMLNGENFKLVPASIMPVSIEWRRVSNVWMLNTAKLIERSTFDVKVITVVKAIVHLLFWWRIGALGASRLTIFICWFKNLFCVNRDKTLIEESFGPADCFYTLALKPSSVSSLPNYILYTDAGTKSPHSCLCENLFGIFCPSLFTIQMEVGRVLVVAYVRIFGILTIN